MSRATGLSFDTVRRGLKECKEIESGQLPALEAHRSRKSGGGRKKLTEKHPGLLPTLEKLVEATTRGDPESPLLWTARSQRNLVDALEAEGYRISKHSLANLLKELGYSLQGNKKKQEGAQHPTVTLSLSTLMKRSADNLMLENRHFRRCQEEGVSRLFQKQWVRNYALKEARNV